jgi:regulator of sigma E protease
MTNLLTPENLLFVPVFLVIISILVAAHEYGHYIFAKLFGMGVEEFSIGMFGRKPVTTYARREYLIPLEPGQIPNTALPEDSGIAGNIVALEGKQNPVQIVQTPSGPALRETTAFTIRPWPIGGFVRIKGMMPEDDGSEISVAGGFYSKPPWQRFIVLLAGPVFSVLAGVVLIFGLFAIVGEPKPDLTPVLDGVMVGSPAEAAGLKNGDRIVSINADPVDSFYDIVTHSRNSGGQHLTFVYLRDGKTYTTDVVPVVNPEKTEVQSPEMTGTGKLAVQAKIGAMPRNKFVRTSIGAAASRALEAPIDAFFAIGSMLSRPAELKQNVGGPISMLRETRSAISDGPANVVFLMAMLSISVGFLNLLPIPPLDGGQMAIAVAEMLRRGRRLSMRVQNAAAMAGVCFVLLLVVAVFTLDISRLGKSDEPRFSDMIHAKTSPPTKANP